MPTLLTHLTTTLPLLLLTLAPLTRACLHLEGWIANLGSGNEIEAAAEDNGSTVCDSDWGWRVDQDGHYSLICWPGYVYAITLDGQTAWYSNGIMSWQIGQRPANADSHQFWNLRMFGC